MATRNIVVFFVIFLIILLVFIYFFVRSIWPARFVTEPGICDCDPGEDGDTGDTGDTGSIGDTGDTGPQGISIKGQTGDTGIQGATGGKGNTGSTGGTGILGLTGSPGIDFHVDAMTNVDDTFFVKTGTTPYELHCAIHQLYMLIVLKDNRVNKAFPPELSASGDLSMHLIVYDCNTGLWTDLGLFNTINGMAGPKGQTGDTGPQGNTGGIGITGSQGSTGPQGQTGPQGATGQKGQTGQTGDTGQQGSTGNQGATGDLAANPGFPILFGSTTIDSPGVSGTPQLDFITSGNFFSIPFAPGFNLTGRGFTSPRAAVISNLWINITYVSGPAPTDFQFNVPISTVSDGTVTVFGALTLVTPVLAAGTSTTVLSASIPFAIPVGTKVALMGICQGATPGNYEYDVSGGILYT